MIRLFELRSEKEMSQREMAKIMNVSQGTYNNWENFNTQPSIEQLIALAGFFGVTVDYLIGNADDYEKIGVRTLSSRQEKFLKLVGGLSSEAQEALFTFLEKLAPQS